MERFDYATVEWLWDAGSIRCNLPGGEERTGKGSYKEIVDTLNGLGSEGWEAVDCCASANWLFWTLKRRAS